MIPGAAAVKYLWSSSGGVCYLYTLEKCGFAKQNSMALRQ